MADDEHDEEQQNLWDAQEEAADQLKEDLKDEDDKE